MAEEDIMRRMAWVFLLLFSLVALPWALSASGISLKINEAETRVSIQTENIEVSLAVENVSGKTVNARIRLELVDPKDKARAESERDVSLNAGANKVAASLSLSTIGHAERKEFLWYRLRYRIDSLEGIVSLSEIMHDLFELKVLSSLVPVEGEIYRVVARAVHPVKLHPVKGVAVDAQVKLDDDTEPLRASTVTDKNGYAIFEFRLPREIASSELEIEVAGRRGGMSQTATDDVSIDHQAWIIVSPDKPIYQPGQMLRARLLARDVTSKRAIADALLIVKISDPENTMLFRATLKTSLFGIASFEWPIPQSARLGQYVIDVEAGEGKYRESRSQQVIKISRYDLPNFTVSVKADRPYYLSGQNAEVEVRADYLFGEPVKSGRVRVVRESDREWNYREQKWEVEEGDYYEGQLDQSNRFIAKISLEENHSDLADRDYARMQDVSYAAYVTDLTTGRTERRLLDIRVTKNPIHIYVIEANNRQTEGLPMQFYVSTFYADGSPAQCDVEIRQSVEPKSDEKVSASRGELMMKVKTNRYGLAKVSNLRVNSEPEFELIARDREGRRGSEKKDWWSYNDRPVIRVETGRTLYRAGEQVTAEITSSAQTGALFVEVSRGYRSIASRVARLSRGRATVSFPYRKEFEGEISITAYLIDPGKSEIEGSRTVLYPAGRELKLEASSGKEYRPGEEANVNLTVLGAKGASALGIVVYDKAVEERARADQQFGYGGGFLDQLRDEDERFGEVRKQDIERLDLTKPLPEGLEMVAEVLLNNRSGGWLNVFGTEEYETQIHKVFSGMLFWQMLRVRATLDPRYNNSNEHPTDLSSLKRILAQAGIDFDGMRDPWGTRYRAEFSIQTIYDAMLIASAGPDKRFDTGDDFAVMGEIRWPYFTSQGEEIDRAVAGYHSRTGRYIRDNSTLASELMREGLNLDELRDRWGKPYRIEFGIEGVNFTVKFVSGGPNGRFDGWDDFTIWTSRIDYFAESRARIDAALAGFFKSRSRFPQNEWEMGEALRIASVNFDDLRDPWGNRFYATFKTEASYADRVTLQSYAVYGSQPEHRAEVVPVTRQINFVTLRSDGPDGKGDTADDFNAAIFSRIVAEQSAHDSPTLPDSEFAFTGLNGAITGTVTDQNGAIITGASVKATHLSSQLIYEIKSNNEGAYAFWDLPAGVYELLFEANGFKKSIVAQVMVSSFDITKVDAALYPGGVSQTVTVTSGASELLMTESAQISARRIEELPSQRGAHLLIVSKSGVLPERVNGRVDTRAQIATPRLREYFPETLLWQPEIVTDEQGRAEIKFKLADNITTWKMAVIASTLGGQVATLEREIRAFQPFFIDHDPPRSLTEGDEIALPVVLRNYLDRAQTVDTEIKPENWFTFLGPAKRRSKVGARDTNREVFEFRAVAPVKEGRQRVTGYGTDMSDAIEKKISVRPNGEEMIQTASKIFNDAASFDLDVPEGAIKRSIEGELRIYPNLLAHIVEGIEAIMQRPYGCAEQTISSAYPSVLALRYYKHQGEEFPAVAQKALRYAQAGYERLIGYQSEDGGFSYWGRGDSDAALTAYALRFLEDVSEFIQVDQDVLQKARDWLIKQQSDGRWVARSWDKSEDHRLTALVTACVTRSLARSRDKTKTAAATRLALDYLARRLDETDEPYLMASLALAAEDAGAKEKAAKAREKLRAAVRDENGAAYWSLEANTPFYGWGLTGRIETSALAVQALAADAKDDLASRGLSFMIRNKDRYGVWYSTQATVNVLDAMLAMLLKQDSRSFASSGQAEIFVNGRRAGLVALPTGRELTGPAMIDLSGFLQTGANRVEIKRGAGSMAATAQLVTTHYEPWVRANDTSVKMESSRALRLKVNFDKTEARAGDEIICRVEAERIGFHGYGMILAEVGLPPGVDVDRASLDLAMKQSGWDISQYDVLPDRVIVYLWPRAGGTRFEFKFKPRYGIRAQNAPSTVYDYYNPEARATVAPVRFVVK